MRKLVFSMLAAAVLAAASGTPAQAQMSRDLLIGGGSVTGVYYQVALHVCNLVNKHSDGAYKLCRAPGSGVRVQHQRREPRACSTSASRSPTATGRLPTVMRTGTARRWAPCGSVFSAHPETVLLVTRADTGIASVEDLVGRAVNIGNPGSGQRGNAEDVLRLHGIDPDSDIDAQGLQQNEASRALIDRKIDAFFYTVGNPAAAIEEPANSTDIRIVPINSQAIRDFIADKPYYVMTSIQPGVYKGVDEPVETYAVKATVVASDALEADVVHDVVRIVMENLDELKAAHAAFRHLDPAAMMGGLSAALHDGARRYYEEQGWM